MPVLSALTTAVTCALADLQELEQSSQHPAAQHYDDSSVISYVCHQVSVARCVNPIHRGWLNMPTQPTHLAQ